MEVLTAVDFSVPWEIYYAIISSGIYKNSKIDLLSRIRKLPGKKGWAIILKHWLSVYFGADHYFAMNAFV